MIVRCFCHSESAILAVRLGRSGWYGMINNDMLEFYDMVTKYSSVPVQREWYINGTMKSEGKGRYS